MDNFQEEKNTKRLIDRYSLTLENLTFEYVSHCKKPKMLERILKVLRSGEEGFFPQLTKYCEEKLTELFPGSRLLTVPQEVLTLSDKQEREDMKACLSVIKEKDKLLTKSALRSAKTQSSVPIRPSAVVLGNKKRACIEGDGDKETPKATRTQASTSKGVHYRSYDFWEKLDIEEAMLKMDLQDEVKDEKTKEKKNKMSKNTKKKVGKYPTYDGPPLVSAKEMLTSTEQVAMALAEKLKGNECYTANDYETAVKHYSNSIALHPTVDHYTNRAAAYLKLEKFREVVCDCCEALNLDLWNEKALYRRATAYKKLNRTDDAIHDFRHVLDVNPSNSAAAQALAKLELEKYNQEKREWENLAGSATLIHPTSSRRMLIQELD